MNYLALGLLLPFAACSFGWSDEEGAGAAAGATRAFQVAGFSDIDLRGSDDVEVRVGTGFSVRAQGPAEQLDSLSIARDGDTLKVGRRNGFHWGRGGKVRVFVTLPRLAAASVSGSGNMRVDRVEGTKFEGNVAGSGNLNVAALQVDEAELSIAGSGDMRLAGTARSLEIAIAGSGDVDAAGLVARSAKVEIAGSGSARAAVNGAAEVSVMGSGDVDLGPNARCRTSKMGSGTVRCGR